MLAAFVRADVPLHAKTLATSVPGDARLFIELRVVEGVFRTPAGSALAELLAGVVKTETSGPTTQPARTQPVGRFRWQRSLAAAVGLKNRQAAELLFTGRLAIAADGWSGIGDAVLLALPVDPAALEGELSSLRLSETSARKVRRYRLGRDHELACDGRVAALGRPGNRSTLYARTRDLLERGEGDCLAEVAEYRERTSTLAADGQFMFYAGGGGQAGSTGGIMGWWPSKWPQPISLAVGVEVTRTTVTAEVNGRLDWGSVAFASDEPPVDSLMALPRSVVAAWTRRMDYTGEYQRMEAKDSNSFVRSYIKVLQTDLPQELIQESLLEHLVGDTILLVDQVTYRPEAKNNVGGRTLPASRPTTSSSPFSVDGVQANDVLLLPAMALAVETDDPDAVADSLLLLADNLLRFLALPEALAGSIHVRKESVGLDDDMILSIPLGPLFAGRTRCVYLNSLAISWAVVDRWLVMATHPETVRRMVLARRGAIPTLKIGPLEDMVSGVAQGREATQMAMVVQPHEASQMIDSWIRYLKRYHAEVLQPDWWQRVRSKDQASRTQLGIIVPARASDRVVEVADTLPNWPAHHRLMPGDKILAVDGHALDQAKPMQSLRQHLALRERAKGVRLLVLRGGKRQEIDIPMTDIASDVEKLLPIGMLQKLADVCRFFSLGTQVIWRDRADVLRARLELQVTAPTTPRSH